MVFTLFSKVAIPLTFHDPDEPEVEGWAPTGGQSSRNRAMRG